MTGGRVAIIGAGAVGVSTAYHLADRGADVTVLDRGHVAGETTGKAAGLIYTQMHEPADVRAMRYGLDFFRELASAENDFEFHETGYLRIGTERERLVFEHEVEMQRAAGANVSLVDPEQIRILESGLSLQGITVGTYCPDDGFADPHTYAGVLLDRAVERGVDYRPKTAVTGITLVNGVATGVETASERIDADAVVIAAGPWSKKVARLAGVDLPLKPYRTHALVTTDVDFAVRPVFDARDGVYFRSEQDGLLAGDGTEELESDPDDYKTTPDFSFLTTVGEVLERRLPVEEVGVQTAWVGLSTATPDGFPLVGNPPVEPGSDETVDGLYVGAGLQGHGFMRSPAVGRALASSILDGEHPYPEYKPGRFDGDPGDFPVVEMMKLDGKHPGLLD